MDISEELHVRATEQAPTTEPKIEVGPDGQPLYPLYEEGHDQSPLEEHIEEEEQVDKFSEPGRVRRLATIMNLLNSLLGAGILGVPGSMKYIGMIPSVIVLFIIAFLSHIATVLTIKLQRRVNATGFDDMAFRVLGKWGSNALSIMVMLFCISCDTAYLIIGSDSIMSFMRFAGINISKGFARGVLVFFFWLCFPGAMTFPRDISFLKYFSFANFACISFFVLSMIIKGYSVFTTTGVAKDVVYSTFGVGVFSAISIYGLAFALPVVVLPIIEPYNKDLKKRTTVSAVATTLCFLLVAIPGVLGYMILGGKAKDNVLLAFPDNDGLILAVRACFLVVVSASFPCVTQSLSASWSQIIYGINVPKELPTMKRVLVLAVSNGIPLFLALFIPNAGPALSIGGAFGGCLADFFFPPIIWFLISKKPWSHWQNLLCLLFMTFGVVACVVSTYLAVVDAIKAFSQ